MLSLNRFDKVAWHVWAGSTPFSDGPPYIAEFQLSDVGVDGLPRDATLVIGAEGAQVHWWGKDGEDNWFVSHSFDGRWSSEDARNLASRLSSLVSLHDLHMLGFSTEPTEC